MTNQPTYTNAQFALMMAMELKKINSGVSVIEAGNCYYEFLKSKAT